MCNYPVRSSDCRTRHIDTFLEAFNLGYPQLAKFITNFESHRNESKVQTSLYVKIAAFRWVNTAIVITYITPFTQTISPKPGLISQIAAIFFAEIVTTNVIQLTDVWGHIQRHLLAPRAKTQDAMNIWFKGLEVELAER
jgi:threonine/homoserine/homoserine lactone efflux protein